MSVSAVDSAVLWLVIGYIGLHAFASRLSFFVVLGSIDDVPSWFESALRFVPPAVFAAFVVPAVVAPAGTVVSPIGSPHFIAGVVAGLIAWRTGSLHGTIIGGMVVFGLARLVVG